jgi:hypothetical protein
LWFLFVAGGLMALALPLREGAFRWLALCWIGYTIVAMMIMHIEPRYLLPVWLMLALYGSWTLGNVGELLRLFRQHYYHMLAALTLASCFLVLFFTYRNYPDIIARGLEREAHNAAGLQAYAAGDYATAVRELRPVVEEHPIFVETQTNLALAYLAQGDYAAAQAVIGDRDSQQLSVIRGAIARAQGDTIRAAEQFTDAETRAGEDMQRFALEWLPVPPISDLELGSGHDPGYIAGFSIGEHTQPQGLPPVSYRWLQGTGRIVLPLPEPLHVGSALELRLTSGRPEPVPLTVGFAGTDPTQHLTFPVRSGVWRVYRLMVPEALAGQSELAFTLDAPVFIPAHIYPDSIDVRPLSLMVSAVRVE